MLLHYCYYYHLTSIIYHTVSPARMGAGRAGQDDRPELRQLRASRPRSGCPIRSASYREPRRGDAGKGGASALKAKGGMGFRSPIGDSPSGTSLPKGHRSVTRSSVVMLIPPLSFPFVLTWGGASERGWWDGFDWIHTFPRFFHAFSSHAYETALFDFAEVDRPPSPFSHPSLPAFLQKGEHEVCQGHVHLCIFPTSD